MSARERTSTNTIRAAKITKGDVATPTGVTYEGGDRQIFVKPNSATPDNVAAYRVTVTNSNVSPVTTNTYIIDKGVATASAGKGVGVPVPVNGVNYGMKVAEIGFNGFAGTDSAQQNVLALKLNPPVLGAAEARNGSVTLNWSAPTGLPSGFAVTSYKIAYTTSANRAGQPDISNTITGISSSATSYLVSGLMNNDKYRFVLSAIINSTYEAKSSIEYSPCVGTNVTADVSLNSLTNTLNLIVKTGFFPTDVSVGGATISYYRTIDQPSSAITVNIPASTFNLTQTYTVTSGIVFDFGYTVSVSFYNMFNSSVITTVQSNIVASPKAPTVSILGSFNFGSSMDANLTLRAVTTDELTLFTCPGFSGSIAKNTTKDNTVSKKGDNTSSFTITIGYSYIIRGTSNKVDTSVNRVFTRTGNIAS